MFGPDVIEKLGFYVYRLIDPRNGETFYVGKGKGNRLYEHVAANSVADVDDGLSSTKIARIRAIHLAGFEVGHVVHRHGMDERTAFEVEAALMEAYPGVTNIVGGHGSDDFGVMHADELSRRYELPVADIRHRVILLTVDRLAAEESLYEATRFAWRIDIRKAADAEYVLPVVAGIIRGAFVAENWMPASADNFPGKPDMVGRYGFKGEVAADEIVEHYRFKRVPAELRKRGAANPVKYAGPSLAP